VSRRATIARGRRFAEAQMTEQCRIVRAAGTPVRGADGELHTPTTLIWEGPCRLRTVSTVTSDVEAAAQLLVTQSAVLFLPVEGTGAIRVNDVATFTEASMDPALAQVKVRIAGLHFDSDATARRLPVEMVS
jgi:hypothetical protein